MEEFGFVPPRLQSWRKRGYGATDVQDLTEQDAVPTLSAMLVGVLQGRGTGIGTCQYDEDDDFDAALTDKIDLEMQRQTIAERVEASRRRKEQAPGVKSPSPSSEKIDDSGSDGGNSPAPSET